MTPVCWGYTYQNTCAFLVWLWPLALWKKWRWPEMWKRWTALSISSWVMNLISSVLVMVTGQTVCFWVWVYWLSKLAVYICIYRCLSDSRNYNISFLWHYINLDIILIMALYWLTLVWRHPYSFIDINKCFLCHNYVQYLLNSLPNNVKHNLTRTVCTGTYSFPCCSSQNISLQLMNIINPLALYVVLDPVAIAMKYTAAFPVCNRLRLCLTTMNARLKFYLILQIIIICIGSYKGILVYGDILWL